MLVDIELAFDCALFRKNCIVAKEHQAQKQRKTALKGNLLSSLLWSMLEALLLRKQQNAHGGKSIVFDF